MGWFTDAHKLVKQALQTIPVTAPFYHVIDKSMKESYVNGAGKYVAVAVAGLPPALIAKIDALIDRGEANTVFTSHKFVGPSKFGDFVAAKGKSAGMPAAAVAKLKERINAAMKKSAPTSLPAFDWSTVGIGGDFKPNLDAPMVKDEGDSGVPWGKIALGAVGVFAAAKLLGGGKRENPRRRRRRR